MTTSWNTKAIVLGYRPFKDNDRIYSVYTEEFGKQNMRAVGIRKLSAKLAGSLEPFAEIDLYMISAKQWPKIGGAVVSHRFKTLSADLSKNNAAWFVCDVLDRTTRENMRDDEVYRLLFSTLTWLDHHPSQRTILYSYVVKLSAMLGYRINNDLPEDQARVIRWLQEQDYEHIQRLRFEQEQWSNLLNTVRTWLFDVSGNHVQTERFLV